MINNKNKIVAIFFIASGFMMLLNSSMAVAESIKGKIFGYDVDRKTTPLRNARIVSIPSMRGAMSSANGEFNFDILGGDSLLVVSSTGYKTDTLLISAIANKQNIEIQMQSIELEGVNVTESKVATTLDFSGGIRTQTITTRGLQKAACCNLSESFTTTPAVDVQYTDAVTGAKRIQLLGLNSIYSQVQQKNIPIMRGLASSYGFAFVPGQWLEEISISKGASNVKNGFESITGLINIDYKKPENEHPTTLNYYINDMLMMEVNADHTINFNDRVGTTFFLHGNYFGKEVDHNDDGFLDKPMGNQINFLNSWNMGTDKWENRSDFQIMLDDRKGGQIGYHNDKSDSLWGMRNKTQRYNANIRNGFMLNEPGTNIGTLLSFTHHKQEAFFGIRTFNGEQNSFYANIMLQAPINVVAHNDDNQTSQSNHRHNLFENSTLTMGFGLQCDNYLELFDSFYYHNNPMTNNNANILIPGFFLEYAFSAIKNLNTIIGIRSDFPNVKLNPNIALFDSVLNVPVDMPNLEKALLTPRIHLKYGLIPDTLILAASVGKGCRFARELAENSGYLASNRKYILETCNTLEEAWNYGANMFYTFRLFGCPIDFNMDFYRTDFVNQLVVDLDRNSEAVHFYSLKEIDGKSYSNAFQVDATFEPITNFFITAAYRMNDVKQTTAGELREKPLQSKHKSFLNLQYNTDMNEWAFDLTFDYNGSGRLPMDANGVIKRYDPFLLINAQITRTFGNFDIYIGSENLTNFMIKDAIKGHLNPFALGFDASMIYGPVTGIAIYLGIRYKIF